MNTVWTYVKANWKTNLVAVVAFAYSVPQFVTAINAARNGQPADWHAAIWSIVIAAGFAVAKDGDNHSTQAQVAQATAEKTAK